MNSPGLVALRAGVKVTGPDLGPVLATTPGIDSPLAGWDRTVAADVVLSIIGIAAIGATIPVGYRRSVQSLTF